MDNTTVKINEWMKARIRHQYIYAVKNNIKYKFVNNL